MIYLKKLEYFKNKNKLFKIIKQFKKNKKIKINSYYN